MANSAPHQKPGTKPKLIDPKQLAALASIQCTYDEIAAVFGIKKRQFIDRLEAAPELKEIIEDGWANGRASIRRQQFKMLMEGNATMAVWLGKQYLGQRDQASIEHAGPGGKPVLDLASVRAYLRSTPDEADDCPTP
jgi:hypothetical protein